MSDTRPTIPPQEGKRYVTRNEIIVGPMRNTGNVLYPFAAPDPDFLGASVYYWSYTKEGRFSFKGAHPEFDLVAEYQEPPIPAKAREWWLFKPMWGLLLMASEEKLEDQEGIHVREVLPGDERDIPLLIAERDTLRHQLADVSAKLTEANARLAETRGSLFIQEETRDELKEALQSLKELL